MHYLWILAVVVLVVGLVLLGLAMAMEKLKSGDNVERDIYNKLDGHRKLLYISGTVLVLSSVGLGVLAYHQGEHHEKRAVVPKKDAEAGFLFF